MSILTYRNFIDFFLNIWQVSKMNQMYIYFYKILNNKTILFKDKNAQNLKWNTCNHIHCYHQYFMFLNWTWNFIQTQMNRGEIVSFLYLYKLLLSVWINIYNYNSNLIHRAGSSLPIVAWHVSSDQTNSPLIYIYLYNKAF